MNLHAFFDTITAGIISMTIGKNRLFSESLESFEYIEALGADSYRL